MQDQPKRTAFYYAFTYSTGLVLSDYRYSGSSTRLSHPEKNTHHKSVIALKKKVNSLYIISDYVLHAT